MNSCRHEPHASMKFPLCKIIVVWNEKTVAVTLFSVIIATGMECLLSPSFIKMRQSLNHFIIIFNIAFPDHKAV